MYSDSLWDLRNLAFPGSPSGSSLDEIKAKADQISEELGAAEGPL
jgi:hypothetical protein